MIAYITYSHPKAWIYTGLTFRWIDRASLIPHDWRSFGAEASKPNEALHGLIQHLLLSSRKLSTKLLKIPPPSFHMMDMLPESAETPTCNIARLPPAISKQRSCNCGVTRGCIWTMTARQYFQTRSPSTAGSTADTFPNCTVTDLLLKWLFSLIVSNVTF